MADLVNIRYLNILGKLSFIHLKSTIVTVIVYCILITVYKSFSGDASDIQNSFTIFAGLSPLFILLSIPVSYLVAFPALIIASFASRYLLVRRVENYAVWILGSFVIGNFYLYFYSELWFLFSIPISILNGVLMCRVARRYYV